MKGAPARFLAAGVIVLALSGGGAAWVYRDWQLALEKPLMTGGGPVLFEIERGLSVRGIAAKIAAQGWIIHPLYIEIEARRTAQAARLQAGVYEIEPGETLRGLLRRFARGDVKVYAVRFIEGMTFADIRRTLGGARHLQRTIAVLGDAEVMYALEAPDVNPEGQFFPASYDYRSGDVDLDILRRARERMHKVLHRQWAARSPGLPYRSPYEALIMASIIEKETGQPAERDRIAGVFVRRLQRGMKLQSDPTVIYGMADSFDGDLRRVDLATDSPYNTYTRYGMPPTPIAVPGEAAIIAGLSPAADNSLYFVARGDGTHEFSVSLEEHNAAVRRFQLER